MASYQALSPSQAFQYSAASCLESELDGYEDLNTLGNPLTSIRREEKNE